jgi:putative NADPH-quinone reductase
MRVSVILAHPAPGSFNHALAGAACSELAGNGHEASPHDLYQEGFDPVLPAGEIAADAALPPLIAGHCAEIAAAEGIVIVHPNWWGQPPAILTGWVDRVLRPRVAYQFLEGEGGEGVPAGLLRARTALVLNTSNTPPEREQAAFGDPLESLWTRCIFGLCGVTDVRRRTFSVIVTSSDEQRGAWLAEARRLVAESFPKTPPFSGLQRPKIPASPPKEA